MLKEGGVGALRTSDWERYVSGPSHQKWGSGPKWTDSAT